MKKRPAAGLFSFLAMERRLASLRAEVSAPERNKFTAPLLLLHGLWSASWIWHEVAGALSQRGWECWALDLRGRPGSRPVEKIGRVTVADYVADVLRAARQLWAAPVICGYDLGALLALLTAAQVRPRAVICLAPLLPQAWVANGRPPAPLVRLSAVPALLWGQALRPPRLAMARDFLFNTLPPAVQSQLYVRLQPDSGVIARALTRGDSSFPVAGAPCPVLVVSGGADRMCPPTTARWLAEHLSAAYRHYPGQGHWLLTGEQGPLLIGDLHRWLVRTLGEALLVPPEEEE
ncbi:MAG TPA: alpha/beta fold hydrolase [Candidatus Binatia bacterium]|jgi:pimeloyl-ACP methyl ester carboxylesterase|nr:alpha/beta fold hydrolase [Candidatus Binatia bacterium]